MNKIYKLRQIETPRLLIRPVQLGDEYPLNKAVNNSLELLQKCMSELEKNLLLIKCA